MMFTISESIGLEEVEKIRGIAIYKSQHEEIKLEMKEIVPVLKKKTPEIIVRDGKLHRNEGRDKFKLF